MNPIQNFQPVTLLDQPLIKGSSFSLTARRAILYICGLGSDGKLEFTQRDWAGGGVGEPERYLESECFLDVFFKNTFILRKGENKAAFKDRAFISHLKKYPNTVGLYKCHKRN